MLENMWHISPFTPWHQNYMCNPEQEKTSFDQKNLNSFSSIYFIVYWILNFSSSSCCSLFSLSHLSWQFVQ